MEPPVSILGVYSIAAWNVTHVKGPMYGVTGNLEYNLPSGVYIICSSVHRHCRPDAVTNLCQHLPQTLGVHNVRDGWPNMLRQ